MSALRSLNPYFWKHKKLLAWGVLFIVLGNFFNIFKIPFIGKTVDEIEHALTLSEAQLADLTSIIITNVLIIIGSSVLSGFFSFMMRQTIIVASRKIEFELKNTIFRKYEALSLTQIKNSSIGDLLNRLSEDVVAIRMYLGPGVMYVANLAVLLLITSIYMLKSDMEMTLWTLIPLPFLSFIIYRVSSIINKKSKILQETQSDISTFVTDAFSGIRVIKFFSKEQYFFGKYAEKVGVNQDKAMDLAKTEAYFFTIIQMVIGLLNVAILIIGGNKYFANQISVGEIANFFMYINILIWPFSMVGWITSVNQRAAASMTRVNEFLNAPIEIPNFNKEDYTIEGNIEFKNVSYTYPNTGITALENVSFRIRAGEKVAITGKTGSGKSTLALLITRQIQPDSGEILIDGIPIEQHNVEVLRREIGYIPQESYLFSDTIANNIAFPLEEGEYDLELIKKYAIKADIDKDIQGFTKAYQTMVGERGVMLSGGQKQRLCIARAMIKQPKILLFDDALSALDTETEEKVLRNIQEDSTGITLILITHRQSTISQADTIIYLD